MDSELRPLAGLAVIVGAIAATGVAAGAAYLIAAGSCALLGQLHARLGLVGVALAVLGWFFLWPAMLAVTLVAGVEARGVPLRDLLHPPRPSRP